MLRCLAKDYDEVAENVEADAAEAEIVHVELLDRVIVHRDIRLLRN
jgi:hypothetical protein